MRALSEENYAMRSQIRRIEAENREVCFLRIAARIVCKSLICSLSSYERRWR